MNMKRVLFAGACAAMLSACANVDQSSCLKMLDGAWTITELDGAAIDSEAAAVEMQMVMSDMQFAGNAGCNSMNGDITADITKKGDIAFEVKAMTKMMCPDMTNEEKLQAVLGKVAKYELDTVSSPAKVVLFDAEGNAVVKMQFLRKNEVDAWSIKGTWKVKAVRGESIDQTESTPEFFFDLENNLFGGNTGCNSMGGSIELTDCTMKFSDPYLTEMLCDEHSMDIENKVAGTLPHIAQWSVENAELHLLDEDGNVLIELIRE